MLSSDSQRPRRPDGIGVLVGTSPTAAFNGTQVSENPSGISLLRTGSHPSLTPYLDLTETICSRRDENGQAFFVATRHTTHQTRGNCAHLWIDTARHAGSVLISVEDNGSVHACFYENGKRPGLDDLSGARSAYTMVYGPSVGTDTVLTDLEEWANERQKAMVEPVRSTEHTLAVG